MFWITCCSFNFITPKVELKCMSKDRRRWIKEAWLRQEMDLRSVTRRQGKVDIRFTANDKRNWIYMLTWDRSSEQLGADDY